MSMILTYKMLYIFQSINSTKFLKVYTDDIIRQLFVDVISVVHMWLRRDSQLKCGLEKSNDVTVN